MNDAPDLDTYRQQARQWLSENLGPRDPGKAAHVRGGGHDTLEAYLPARALQKKIYEAGYAGIDWPKEYGGQGLTPAPKHRGLTWFAVPLRAAGVSVHPIREITGGAEFCQEFLDGVRVRGDEVIGEVDQGWTVA